MMKEKHGVKSRLFVDWDMGTPLSVFKVRRLLKNLLSDLGFSQDKTPYSFKYVAMSHLLNQNVSIESINEAARYATGSKMVRDRYAISASQMWIHKLLAEAAQIVDTRSSREEPPTPSLKGSVSSISSREEHLLPSSKGTISSISSKEEHLLSSSKGSITSKRTFLKNAFPKSNPLINLSTFIPKSCTQNDMSNRRRAAFNKCNVTIVEVIKKEKPEYVLPDFISYPSSEDECGNVNGTKVPKRNKKSSENTFVSPKAPVLLTNNTGENKFPKIMYVTPKEHVLPSMEHVSSINDFDSDKGLFSSENVSENDTRSSEEALIN
jgi:hypothetical protein